MKFSIITLFPDMFNGVFSSSIIARAIKNNLIEIEIINLREYSSNKHKTVDDYPFGGGNGMLLKAEPIFAAVEKIRCEDSYTILLTPAGRKFTQSVVNCLDSSYSQIILICGHYEGVDERVAEHLVDECISVGDYVLSGGEIPAMLVVDALTRVIPGAIGAEDGAKNDSFASGMLEYPQYTRPANFRGFEVPLVLLSGNHKLIEDWRKEQSLIKTRAVRPDLLL